MSLYEERLGAVENGLKLFQTETIHAHQEVAMELTLVKGLTHDSIKRITELKIEVHQRFNAVHQEMAESKQEINQRFNIMDQQIAEMKQDVRGVNGKLDRLEKLILDRLPPP